MNYTEEEQRRRILIGSVAMKLWIEGAPISKITEATGSSYHLFKSCVLAIDPKFFDNYPRRRGRKFTYRDSLTPEELAEAARMYILKEKKPWQICAHFKVAPYLLRKVLKKAGVWRDAPTKAKFEHSYISEPAIKPVPEKGEEVSGTEKIQGKS